MPRLRPTRPSSLAASAGILMAGGVLAADFSSSSNVAAYWGQNSYGQSTGPLSQQNLASYCADTNVDIIPLAFMIQLTGGYNTRTNTTTNAYFGSNEKSRRNQTITNRGIGEQRMVVNFANAGNNCSIFSGTGLLDCGETIGEDIKTCQETYGKTILLSIGGATYTEGGFASEDAAIAAADMVWKAFGPTNDGSTSTNTTSPSVGDVITTTVIASNADATTTMTFTFTENATFATSVLTTPGAGDPANTSRASMVSGGLPVLTSSVSVSQDDGGSATTSDTYSGPALSSATATSTGNPDMDTNTIPTVNPTVIDGTGPVETSGMSRTTAISTGMDNLEPSMDLQAALTSSEAAPRSISTVALSSFATVAEKTSRKARRQAAEVLRPFGDAVVDGFDIDLESSTQNFLPFVRRLRELMDGDSAKSYYMTAAPQCPYPDAAVSQLLDSDVRFDAVFVQFYNNYCGAQSFTAGTPTQTNFNFETWDAWAKNATLRWASPASNTTTNKRQAPGPAGVKVFLGIPGGVTGAGSGYVPLEQLKPVVEYSKQFESFGGVMMWDASQAKANDGFLPGVKAMLGAAAGPGTTSAAMPPATSAEGPPSSSETLASSAQSPAGTEMPSSITGTPASPTEAVASSTESASLSTILSSVTDSVVSPTGTLAPPTPFSTPSSSTGGLTCSCAAVGVTITITATQQAAAPSSISEAALTETSALQSSSRCPTLSGALTPDSANGLHLSSTTEAPAGEAITSFMATTSAASQSRPMESIPLPSVSVTPLQETASSALHNTSNTSPTSAHGNSSLEMSQSSSEALPLSTSTMSLAVATEVLNTDTVLSSTTSDAPSSSVLVTSSDRSTSARTTSSSSETFPAAATVTLTNEFAEATATDNLESNELPSPSGDLISSIFPTGPDAATSTELEAPTRSSGRDSSSGTREASASSTPNADSALASLTSSQSTSGSGSSSGTREASISSTLDAVSALPSTTSSESTSVWDLHSSVRSSGFKTSTTTAAGLSSPMESLTSNTQSSDAPTATPISPTSTNIPILRSRVVRKRMRMAWQG